MKDIETRANDLSEMERRFLTGWDGPRGAAYNTVLNDLQRKGLTNAVGWNLNERGQAVRDYLKGEK